MHRAATALPSVDVTVLGAGPAGLALAREAAHQGLRVQVIAPAPNARWQRNFGCFEDELAGLPELVAVEARYPRPAVWLGDRTPRVLARSYVRLSTPRLQKELLRGCALRGVGMRAGKAVEVRHRSDASQVRLADGEVLTTRLVVDATGGASRFVERRVGPAPAYQSAYGELLDVARHPYADGEMALMDFRQPDPLAAASPTFGYALPLSPTRIFVEETCLVGRPPLSPRLLQHRLEQRLAALRIVVRRRLGIEHCLIPMGVSLPSQPQRTLAFGAAASLVHPATGYQLSTAFRLSPVLGRAIADGLAEGPVRASELAYAALWPPARQHAWRLYRFGMEFLANADAATLSEFLHAFFRLPQASWSGFMAGSATPTQIYAAMFGVFRRAGLPLKSRLLRAGLDRSGSSLLRAAPSENAP